MLALLPWRWSCENRNRPSALFPSPCQRICWGSPIMSYGFCTDFTSESLTTLKGAREMSLTSMAGFHPIIFQVEEAISHSWCLKPVGNILAHGKSLAPCGLQISFSEFCPVSSKRKIRPCTAIDFIPRCWLLYPSYTWWVNLSLFYLFIYMDWCSILSSQKVFVDVIRRRGLMRRAWVS